MKELPNKELYQPRFSPWEGMDFKALLTKIGCIRPFTKVSTDRLWIIYSLAQQSYDCYIPGHFYEAGVMHGGTALLLKSVMESDNRPWKRLRLFDTFTGIPKADPKYDYVKKGDFGSANFQEVRRRLGVSSSITYHIGVIPETFKNLKDDRISFAHIDVDTYKSVMDCCIFIYPRLSYGSFIVFDDYGFSSCPGARKAVDEFFKDKPEIPLILHTGQAIIFRGDYKFLQHNITQQIT